MSKTYEDYEYFYAEIMDGQCTFRYMVPGAGVEGRDRHDEDVSDWTDREIKQLASDLLDVDPDFVEVQWD